MKSKLVIQPTNASSDCCGRHDKDGKQDEHQLTNPKDENLSLQCQNVAASSENPGKEGSRPCNLIDRSQSFDCFV